nr:hypothetical protein [uncultured Pseudomonas sp.]
MAKFNKVWRWFKQLAVLFLVALALNAAVQLGVLLPHVVKHVGVTTTLGHTMLITTGIDIVAVALVSSVVPAVFLMMNMHRSAYAAMVIGMLAGFQIKVASAVAKLLILLWLFGVAVWFGGCKVRDVYRYYKAR